MRSRVLLVGAFGHGKWHLENVRRLAQLGIVALVGVCDLRPLNEQQRALVGQADVGDSLERMLAAIEPDVVIIATPIHTHVELTALAIRTGCHVLLEKPPASCLEDFQRLVSLVADGDRSCQIGFQSLGSAALEEVRKLTAGGAIGVLRGIGAAGAWFRDSSYYQRSSWAGRRRLDGTDVVDGALTNPFAHAVMTALSVDGSEGPDDLDDIAIELYRANPIEADDTSSVRLRTSKGTTITVAVTLAAADNHDPYLVIHGSQGRITLWYKRDEVRLENATATRTTVHPRTDLLENLLAHISDDAVPLLVPPERTASFMNVVEAVRTAPDPIQIPQQFRRVEVDGDVERHIVKGVDAAVSASAEHLLLFSELELGWAGSGSVASDDERARRVV